MDGIVRLRRRLSGRTAILSGVIQTDAFCGGRVHTPVDIITKLPEFSIKVCNICKKVIQKRLRIHPCVHAQKFRHISVHFFQNHIQTFDIRAIGRNAVPIKVFEDGTLLVVFLDGTEIECKNEEE